MEIFKRLADVVVPTAFEAASKVERLKECTLVKTIAADNGLQSVDHCGVILLVFSPESMLFMPYGGEMRQISPDE